MKGLPKLNFLMTRNIGSHLGHHIQIKLVYDFTLEAPCVLHYFRAESSENIFDEAGRWLFFNSRVIRKTNEYHRQFTDFRYTIKDYPSFTVTWRMTDGSYETEYIVGDARNYFTGLRVDVYDEPFKSNLSVKRNRQSWLIPEGSEYAVL